MFVGEGKLYFDPCMLRKDEFLLEDKIFNYVNINSQAKELTVAKGSLCFTYCQVPIVYTVAEEYALEVHFNDGTVQAFSNLSLNKATSQKVFDRVGEVIQINVRIKKDHLK